MDSLRVQGWNTHLESSLGVTKPRGCSCSGTSTVMRYLHWRCYCRGSRQRKADGQVPAGQERVPRSCSRDMGANRLGRELRGPFGLRVHGWLSNWRSDYPRIVVQRLATEERAV